MLFLLQTLGLLLGVATAAHDGDPLRPYPIPDAGLANSTTSILNHTSYLTELADQQWYLDNIPFVDIPDKLLQDVYYYRQSVVKRHLKFERQGHGKLGEVYAGDRAPSSARPGLLYVLTSRAIAKAG